MKQAVIIGAGGIGRGFLGQILTESGYAVTFIDVSGPLVDLLNQRGEYPLALLSPSGTKLKIVGPVCAVNGKDKEASSRAIALCDLCVTCVGANAIPHTVGNLAAGIKLRVSLRGDPLNILICENLLNTDVYASKRERCSYDTARFILYILQNNGRKCGSWLSTKRTWKRSSERRKEKRAVAFSPFLKCECDSPCLIANSFVLRYSIIACEGAIPRRKNTFRPAL